MSLQKLHPQPVASLRQCLPRSWTLMASHSRVQCLCFSALHGTCYYLDCISYSLMGSVYVSLSISTHVWTSTFLCCHYSPQSRNWAWGSCWHSDNSGNIVLSSRWDFCLLGLYALLIESTWVKNCIRWKWLSFLIWHDFHLRGFCLTVISLEILFMVCETWDWDRSLSEGLYLLGSDAM